MSFAASAGAMLRITMASRIFRVTNRAGEEMHVGFALGRDLRLVGQRPVVWMKRLSH